MSQRSPVVLRVAITLLILVAALSYSPRSASRLLAAEPASGTAAAWPPKFKRVLPPVVPPLGEAELKLVIAARDELKAAVDKLPQDSTEEGEPSARADVEIFHKAIDLAIRHNEFFDPKRDLARVEALKKAGLARAASLAKGEQPWEEQRGVVVRGFRSSLDGSAQPYALVIPEKLDLSQPVPLYIWLHGRGDKQCDLQFISQFLDPAKKPGPLLPDNAIVLHPFGRYCNGYKSAGEVDVFEALTDVTMRYDIDEARTVMAGFSMGGAGAWHLGAHYADQWCVVHAGAGFVDTRRYQKITPEKMPPPYVQTLWGLYDVPDYRRNLLNVPLIAYSGADDAQKAAADIMEQELAQEGLKLTHIIGPGVGHKYEPKALAEVQSRISDMVVKGQNQIPDKITLQTRTLRYSTQYHLAMWGLERHWEDARVDFEQTGDKATLKTKNVTALSLSDEELKKVEIDGVVLTSTAAESGQHCFLKAGARWKPVSEDEMDKYMEKRKSPTRQGPIDDAFNYPFTIVRPETPLQPTAIDRWAEFESMHFAERWAELMRGDPKIAVAAEVDDETIDNRALILWGTPKSNSLIAKVLDKLPIRWTEKTVGIGNLEFDATKVVPVLIYPNPLNPQQYVVLNSGLTFREGWDHTNSQQNPKLPDWALVDITQPPTEQLPGKIVAAGFFDEEWKFDPKRTWKE
jgi:hypothetical protein